MIIELYISNEYININNSLDNWTGSTYFNEYTIKDYSPIISNNFVENKHGIMSYFPGVILTLHEEASFFIILSFCFLRCA